MVLSVSHCLFVCLYFCVFIFSTLGSSSFPYDCNFQGVDMNQLLGNNGKGYHVADSSDWKWVSHWYFSPCSIHPSLDSPLGQGMFGPGMNGASTTYVPFPTKSSWSFLDETNPTAGVKQTFEMSERSVTGSRHDRVDHYNLEVDYLCRPHSNPDFEVKTFTKDFGMTTRFHVIIHSATACEVYNAIHKPPAAVPEFDQCSYKGLDLSKLNNGRGGFSHAFGLKTWYFAGCSGVHPALSHGSGVFGVSDDGVTSVFVQSSAKSSWDYLDQINRGAGLVQTFDVFVPTTGAEAGHPQTLRVEYVCKEKSSNDFQLFFYRPSPDVPTRKPVRYRIAIDSNAACKLAKEFERTQNRARANFDSAEDEGNDDSHLFSSPHHHQKLFPRKSRSAQISVEVNVQQD